MNPLTFTIPDQPIIDGLRGFVAVAGIILIISGPFTWWRLRAVLPRRVFGLFVVFIGADIYITATELQQIGHRMLVWRLPLGFLVILGALVYIARLAVAVADQRPIR